MKTKNFLAISLFFCYYIKQKKGDYMNQEEIINKKIQIYEGIRLNIEEHLKLTKIQIKENITIKNKRSEFNNVTKKIKIFKSVQLLFKDYFIKQIAQELKTSTSTIQRYLNNPIIEEELGENIKIEVEKRLKNNLHKGKIKGGVNYALNNTPIKLENGQFTGSIKK